MYGFGNKLKESLVVSLEEKRALARPMRRWHNDFEIDVNVRG
jgi:hypothetical protein